MTPAPRRLVVLGTGFAAFNLVKHLGDGYDVTVVSPRNHFLFTPLLPSTTVGTIEFRSIIEPIRHARRTLRFFHAGAEALDAASRTVFCAGISDGHRFTVVYDTLVVAVGAVSNTFNVPGVADHALFLKELSRCAASCAAVSFNASSGRTFRTFRAANGNACSISWCAAAVRPAWSLPRN